MKVNMLTECKHRKSDCKYLKLGYFVSSGERNLVVIYDKYE